MPGGTGFTSDEPAAARLGKGGGCGFVFAITSLKRVAGSLDFTN
jgi:hypothetical protein